MSKHAQSITRTHQAQAGGGMLQAKHSEEALGGSDNRAPSQDLKAVSSPRNLP